MLAACAAVAALIALPSPAAASPPPVNWSFYINTYNTSVAYNDGCGDGQWATNNGSVDIAVILDFGAQNAANTGTLLPLTNTSVTYAQAITYAEQWATGFYFCTGANTTSIMTLGVGTNNSGSTQTPATTRGTSWAGLINSIVSYLNANGAGSQVRIEAANDIEPGYSSWQQVNDWEYGYQANSAIEYIDFGSADGCPTTSNGGACSNGWTQDEIWLISYGTARAYFPSPEVYRTAQGSQWQAASNWGNSDHGQAIAFLGPLDE